MDVDKPTLNLSDEATREERIVAVAHDLERDLIAQCGSEKEAYQEACRLVVRYAASVSPGFMRIGRPR